MCNVKNMSVGIFKIALDLGLLALHTLHMLYSEAVAENDFSQKCWQQ
jgi:hypothetical protein